MKKDKIIGIDTSAYTTSVALTDSRKEIIRDIRISLPVPPGMKGLRQSEARSMHEKNLEEIFLHLEQDHDLMEMAAVSVSARPRPVSGSYMPVFLAGTEKAQRLAGRLSIPCFEFSHQEGHIAAVKEKSIFRDEDTFLYWHISGGTCELIKVQKSRQQIIGGSKDISFGQLIDRVGVFLGMAFPSGKMMDEKAEKSFERSQKISQEGSSGISGYPANYLTPIKADGLMFNLSGIETNALRSIKKNAGKEEIIILELFGKIAERIEKTTCDACRKKDIRKVIFAGGVASSRFLRRYLRRSRDIRNENIETLFGDLSEDNAVGIAYLGGRKLWRQNP